MMWYFMESMQASSNRNNHTIRDTYVLINPFGIFLILFFSAIGSGSGTGSGVLGFSIMAGNWNDNRP